MSHLFRRLSIRTQLLVLLLLVLVPLLIFQGLELRDKFNTLYAHEVQSNLEVARATRTMFVSYVNSVLRAEAALLVEMESHNFTLERISHTFEKVDKYGGYLKRLMWLNREGRVIASNVPGAVGLDASDRSYFREIAQSQRSWSIADLVMGRATGEPTFAINRAVRDASGNLIGVLAAMITEDTLREELSFERGHLAAISLVDRNGMLVFRNPHAAMTWEQRNWLKAYPQYKDVFAGNEFVGTVVAHYDNKPRIIALVPVPFGWAAGAGRTEAEVVGEVMAQIRDSVILFGVFLLAGLACAAVISRQITKSVVALREQTDAIGRGDYIARASIPETREFRDLALSLGSMTKGIQEREQALRESEAKLTAIIEQLPVGVGVVNSEGEYIISNSIIKRYAPRTLMALDLDRRSQWVGRDQRGNVIPFDQWPGPRALRGETVNPGIEFEHTDQGGSKRWVIVSAVPFQLDGKTIGAILVYQDITERRKALTALRSSERRLLVAKTAAAMGIHDHDVTTGNVQWDERVRELWGVEATEPITYQTFILSVNPDDRAAVQAAVEKSLDPDGDGMYFCQYRVKNRKDLTERWIEATGRTSFDEGKPVRLIGTVLDITARKQAEEELRRLNENLESLVKERTAALEEKTHQLRRLAGELTLIEQRERLNLSRVLHDGLQQYLVAARLQIDGIASERDLESAKQAATAIEQLLSEAIQVSRTLAAELSPHVLRDSGILAGLEWLTRWMLEKHGLKVQLVMEMDAPALSEDVKVLLFESVREILLNVVKHAKTRSAQIHLSLSEDNQLNITVSDYGRGFESDQSKVATTATGFGLFSIQERVTLIGGKFEIDSTPGKGTKVTISAPIEIHEPPKEMVTPSPALPELYPDPATSGRIRILITDDHVVMREGLSRLLSHEPDFEIVGEAGDGQQGIEKAASLQPDLILMDISMPVLNGIEATRIINKRHPEIKIIGLSLYTEDERAREMLSAGASFYMSKSGPTSELISAIRSCCTRKACQAETAPNPEAATQSISKGSGRKVH